LERGEAGILRRILPDLGENDQLKADARALADEVARRQQAGEAPLSQTRGGVNAFGWNKRRATEAAGYALKSGWLSLDPVSGRKGLFLCPPLFLFEQQKRSQATKFTWHTKEWYAYRRRDNGTQWHR